jgi:hypothetical protein
MTVERAFKRVANLLLKHGIPSDLYKITIDEDDELVMTIGKFHPDEDFVYSYNIKMVNRLWTFEEEMEFFETRIINKIKESNALLEYKLNLLAKE